MNILSGITKFIIALIVIAVFSNQGYTDERQPPSSSTLERELASIAREGTDTQTKVLIDGTTIIPSPGSSYSIKSFPESLSDDSNIDMVIVVNRGLVRIIGGYLNYNSPIIILTPSAKLTVENADVMVSVDENGVTRASMVYGKSLTMESGGSREVAIKPGYELVSESAVSPPKAAMKQDKKIIVATATAPESGLKSSNQEGTSSDGDTDSSDSENYSDATDEDKIQTSTLDTSSLLPNLSGSGSGPSADPLGIVLGANVANDPNLNSGIDQQNGDRQGAHQELACCTSTPARRSRGLSTNRLYTSEDRLTQQLSDAMTNPIQLLDDADNRQARYEFINDNTIVVELNNDPNPHPLGSDSSADSEDAAVIFDKLEKNQFSIDDSIIIENNYETILTPPDQIQDDQGNRFSEFAEYQILTAGFQVESVDTGPPGSFDLFTRDLENFILLEVNATDELTLEEINERYIFAAGDVIAENQDLNEITIDQFFLSAGLNNYLSANDKVPGVTRTADIRAFARDESVINQNLGSLSDSGLLVVNHKSNSNQPTRVLHADFSLVGTGTNQASTISTTLGEVEYKNTRFDDNLAPGEQGTSSPDGANDVVFNATTLGSTQGTGKLVAFDSEVFNTSAGGGLDTLGSGPGYADYFVLENFDPNDPAIAGTEHAIGTDSSSDQQYAFLRLASIQSSTPESGLIRTQNSSNGGYVAGLVNTETGNNSLSIDYLLSGADPETNLSINNDLASSGLSVDMNFNNGQSLLLGGNDNNATYVDDDRFAATNGSATLVSAGLVESGIDPAIASKIDIPEYMQWGFFFGDVDVSATGTSHAHLASWVAGSVPSAADLPVSGSATYTGSAIGNVFAGANSYVAAGTYTNTWDFAARTGTAQLQEFDGVNYNGITALENNSSRFVGALANGAGSREVGLQGSFVQNAGDAAAGVMGQFYIQNTDSDVYRAAGTFAADKQ